MELCFCFYISAKNIKNCAPRLKSMRLCIVSIHDIRSQKPIRPTPMSFFLGTLHTGMNPNKKYSFFQKCYCYILLESLLKAKQKIIKELGLKMDS